jgi:hypothetical protein
MFGLGFALGLMLGRIIREADAKHPAVNRRIAGSSPTSPCHLEITHGRFSFEPWIRSSDDRSLQGWHMLHTDPHRIRTHGLGEGRVTGQMANVGNVSGRSRE